MKPTDDNPWITHRTDVRYENPWIRVTESDVTNPSGSKGIYGVVHFKNRAVGIIPVDEEGHTYLVGQYRYTLNSFEWEIPAGGCPEDEQLEDTACRELREETGLTASTLEPLIINMALSNSISDERAFVYKATELTKGTASQEDTEELSVRRLPLEQTIQMVLDGEITDSMSVAGLLRIALVK